jgi:expansin (peptidoglycan-binding protein)
VAGKRTWVVAVVTATSVGVVGGGVGIVSALARTGCEIAYDVTPLRDQGFAADLQVRNTGSTPVKGWSMNWTFPGNQRVTSGWNGTFTQNGSRVTVRAMDWNRVIAPDAALRLRFLGLHPGNNPQPASFRLNGVACMVAGGPPSTRPTGGPAPTGAKPTGTDTPPATPAGSATTTSILVPTTTLPSKARRVPSTTRPVPPTTGRFPATPAPTASVPGTPRAAPTMSGSPRQVLGAGRIQYGPVYTGEGTFHGATGEGTCSYEATPDRMIAAMNETDYQNSQACGAYVAVTGPSGATVTVKIVDRCQKCKPGDIDLGEEAFARLAAPSAGRIKISWTLLSPALSGPVTYRYEKGSSTYWCAIQVRHHRNPVRTLEVLVDGKWKSLPRQTYNYFVSPDGTGCGGTLRVTDIYGHQLVDPGKTIRADAVQQGRSQFGSPS